MDAAFRANLERIEALLYDHMNIIKKENDRIIVELRILPEHQNQYGCLHSYVLYALSSAAAEYAVAADGKIYIPKSSNINILKSVTQERSLRAEASVSYHADRTALVEVFVADDCGNVLTTGRYTFCASGEPGMYIKEDGELSAR